MNVLKPHLQTTIATLLAARRSQREIERVTGIDRKTIRAYQKRLTPAAASNSPGVATGSVEQTPPGWPPAPVGVSTSACEPYRTWIEAQLKLRRNAMAIYQDLSKNPRGDSLQGLVKVRFRDLAKNTAHVMTLFALSNLWMARKHMMALQGAVRRKAA